MLEPNILKKNFNLKNIVLSTEVNIINNKKEINVVASTPRLIIKSVTKEDIPFYREKIWGDKDVMKKFANGIVRKYINEESHTLNKVDYAKYRIKDWINRWKNGNPWSGFTVFNKNTGEPLGTIVIGKGELAYLFKKKSWGQGIASESVVTLTNVILPMLYKKDESLLEFKKVEATVRIDHIASQKILSRCGFKTDKKIYMKVWGGKEFARYIYKSRVLSLVKKYDILKNNNTDPKSTQLKKNKVGNTLKKQIKNKS